MTNTPFAYYHTLTTGRRPGVFAYDADCPWSRWLESHPDKAVWKVQPLYTANPSPDEVCVVAEAEAMRPRSPAPTDAP